MARKAGTARQAPANRIPDYVTEDELARFLRVTPRLVRVWAMMGMPVRGMPNGAKLLDWLAPPDAPDKVELLTQEEMASELGLTTRQLQNLEEKGLKAVGDRASKRYAYPITFAWYHTYRRRYELGDRRAIAHLDWEEACDDFQDFCAFARAIYRAQHPELEASDGPLDDDAKGCLPMARQIVASGRPWEGNQFIWRRPGGRDTD